MSTQPQLNGSGFVWLASYPKSGNTWTRTFLSNYLRETEDEADINHLYGGPIASSRVLFDQATGLEAANLLPEEIENLRPAVYRWLHRTHNQARIVKTHDAWKLTKNGEPLFPTDATRGTIYIVRNPLDVAVSAAHHNGQSIEMMVEQLCNEQYTLSVGQQALSQQLPQFMGTWSAHVRSWTRTCDHPVHLMRYEDMLHDPSKSFTEMLRFMSIDVDAARLEQAVEASSFERLQEQESRVGFRERRLKSTAPFFRKGIAGGWRDELPKGLADKLIHSHADVMQELGYLNDDQFPRD